MKTNKQHKAKLVILIIATLFASLLSEVKAQQAVFEIPVNKSKQQTLIAGLPEVKSRLSAEQLQAIKIAAQLQAQESYDISKLSANGFKTEYYQIYRNAGQRFGLDWQVLAALHRIETGQRGDTSIRSYAGAQGPMQFLPSTFRAYAIDGDGDGISRIGDVDDAIFSAANYVSANKRMGGLNKAIYQYNHSHAYVAKVLQMSRSLY